jgi:hypothetical protein
VPGSAKPVIQLSGRAVFIAWLRKFHGWIGLWGAALGLLFGVTGILQNHRAVMKIPLAGPQESSLQIALPSPAPVDAQAMADWLQKELALDRPFGRVRREGAKPVAWGDKSLKQPERWSANLKSPRESVQAEYWVGNTFVNVKRSENTFLGSLNTLHKAEGVSVSWILLADTLAGSIILLSLSGLTLWMMTHRRRIVGVSIGLVSVGTLVVLAMQTM